MIHQLIQEPDVQPCSVQKWIDLSWASTAFHPENILCSARWEEGGIRYHCSWEFKEILKGWPCERSCYQFQAKASKCETTCYVTSPWCLEWYWEVGACIHRVSWQIFWLHEGWMVWHCDCTKARPELIASHDGDELMCWSHFDCNLTMIYCSKCI